MTAIEKSLSLFWQGTKDNIGCVVCFIISGSLAMDVCVERIQPAYRQAKNVYPKKHLSKCMGQKPGSVIPFHMGHRLESKLYK